MLLKVAQVNGQHGESSVKRVKHMLKCHSTNRNDPKPLTGTVAASCVPQKMPLRSTKCHRKPLRSPYDLKT